jgi:phosphoribosylaminoimidazole (AIR) synthetase
MGVGLVLAVPAVQANDVILAAEALGERAYIAGSVEAGAGEEPLMIKYV